MWRGSPRWRGGGGGRGGPGAPRLGGGRWGRRRGGRAGVPVPAGGLWGRPRGLGGGAALAEAAPLCPRLAGEAARLEEARLAVIEQRIGGDLALGPHGEGGGGLGESGRA